MPKPKFLAFALDPGEVAGWGVATCAELPLELGIAKSMSDRKWVCQHVKSMSEELGLPILVVAEEWTAGGPRAHYKMYTGLGENYGRWLDWIELILETPKDKILRVTPQTWRNGLFTPEVLQQYCSGFDRSWKMKRLACAYVSPSPSLAKSRRDHNAAEAACIACWAHCSIEGVEAAERVIRAWRL